MQNKHLNFDFEVKSIAEDGSFSGYASVFEVIDSQSDIIIQGAFRRSIKDRVGEVKLLWQHKTDEPIGYFTSIKEDEYGLFVEGQLLLDVQRADEAYALMRAGALKGMSIGYAVTKASYDDELGLRYIEDVDLFEISLVTFPANESATITYVKSYVPCDIREFEKFLRDSGYSRSKAKEIASGGFKNNAEIFDLSLSLERALGCLAS